MKPNLPLNTTIGNRDLCAWQPSRGVVWIQTRNPDHAANLRRRSDSRLVVRSVHGGYLMTYEFTKKSIAWAKRLIDRYTLALACTNARINDQGCQPANFSTENGSM